MRRAADDGRVRKVSANPPDVSTRANLVPSCRGQAQGKQAWARVDRHRRVQSKGRKRSEEKRFRMALGGEKEIQGWYSSGQKEI